jgi:hypothetical protein
LWYDKTNSDVFSLPYVKGGQISVQWGDLQTGPDTYNWVALDSQLAQAAQAHRLVSVQANGNIKPAYLFDIVPYTSNWGGVQVRDKRGVLMYWHPAFEQAYLDFIAHFADHLGSSPYRSTILGARQNFNGVGTEKLPIPGDKQALSAWTIPAGDEQATAWSKTAQLDYQKKVLDAFVSEFVKGQEKPLPVFVRNNLEEVLIEPYKEDFAKGVLSWFHTSSEIEPRGASVARQYEVFRTYVLPGLTLGYAEPWASAWGDHGGKVDPRWTSPPQWNYWRLLSDLSMGISYIGVYSNDLKVALDGTYMKKQVGDDYKRQFDEAYRFAAKYAGFHDDPEHSPGAWIAFRRSETIQGSDYNEQVTDYSMLATLLNPQDTIGMDARKDGAAAPVAANRTVAGTKSIGPYEQRYGAWARKLPGGKSMSLKLNPEFVESLGGGGATVNVTYLDDQAGRSFTVTVDRETHLVALTGSGSWQTAAIPLAKAVLAADAQGANLTLTSADGAGVIFHMVEVTRGR